MKPKMTLQLCHAMASQIKPVSSSTCSAYVSWCTAFLCTHGAGRHIISMSPEASEVHLSAKIWFSPEHPQTWNQQTTDVFFPPCTIHVTKFFILYITFISVFSFSAMEQLLKTQAIGATPTDCECLCLHAWCPVHGSRSRLCLAHMYAWYQYRKLWQMPFMVS